MLEWQDGSRGESQVESVGKDNGIFGLIVKKLISVHLCRTCTPGGYGSSKGALECWAVGVVDQEKEKGGGVQCEVLEKDSRTKCTILKIYVYEKGVEVGEVC